jgi:hypothetical protein
MDVYTEWLRIPKKTSELSKLVSEAGMCSFLRAWWLFQSDFVEQFATMCYLIGEVNQIELYTLHLRRHCQNTKDFVTVFSDIFKFSNIKVSSGGDPVL